MTTTLAALTAGSTSIKYVVAIEGYNRLLTDADLTAAVTAHTAHSGGDWTAALGGLFVELGNSQRIDPYSPFTGGGSCVISVLDVDGADRFGIDVSRRSAGVETVLTATIDRDDTAIPVAMNTAFAAATSDLYIGTECIEYSAKVGTTSFTASKRGKYSPFPAGGTGSSRFGGQHRVSYDARHVLLNPTISQQPRVWLGRRVGVWMHTVDAAGTLNSYADAQLVFAGVLVDITDDANNMCTRFTLKHILDVVQDASIGRDIYGGEIGDGLYLQTGREFHFEDWYVGVAVKKATKLVVVASGASGANQINAGYYSGEQICQVFNRWLGSEKDATRIYGLYTWGYGITSSAGLRTKCYWRITAASDVFCTMLINMPGEVSAFLGMREIAGSELGQTVGIGDDSRTNKSPHEITEGGAVPFVSLMFKPSGPGHSQEFSEALTYVVQNERGVFINQVGSLPAVVNASASSQNGQPWGIFLIDEKDLVIASYSTTTHALTNVWIAPWRQTGANDPEALSYIGRRLDEPSQGPVTIRQVFVLTGTFRKIMGLLFYGSGTAGYNHATYDTLGFGAGIPGSLLGAEFDRILASLPGADAELAIVFDESTSLPDVIASDLLLRRLSLRWYNEHLEFIAWQTPAGALSRTTLAEENKAAVGDESHRIPTKETSAFQRPLVKIDYDRDFAIGRSGEYRKSIQLEDIVAVDDGGGEARPLTIKARNTYSDFAGTGAAIEELTKNYLATMPQFSRTARHITRTLDMRSWEALGVGDIVTVTDEFARDPATGLRGINSRYGIVVALSYDPGGTSPNGSVRPMSGRVEVRMPDVNRHLPYGPSARVDNTATNGGYIVATKVLTCYAHQYSEASEAVDATRFPAGYKVRIVEIDAADPATALSWDDIVASQTGNTMTLTTGLAAWSSTKRYRVLFDTYGDGVIAQRDYAYQADATDQMVEDIEAAYQYSNTNETIDTTANTGTDKAVLHANVLFGDGKSLDAGSEADLINTINMLIDRKSATQSPCFAPQVTGSGGVGVYIATYCGPIFCGRDFVGVGVTRSLTIAPVARLQAAGTGSLRITLSRNFPMVGPSFAPGGSGGFSNTRFGDIISQATWTVSSTTLSTLTEQSLSLAVKHPNTGIVWLTVEGSTVGAIGIEYWGLGKCIEGPRTLV